MRSPRTSSPRTGGLPRCPGRSPRSPAPPRSLRRRTPPCRLQPASSHGMRSLPLKYSSGNFEGLHGVTETDTRYPNTRRTRTTPNKSPRASFTRAPHGVSVILPATYAGRESRVEQKRLAQRPRFDLLGRRRRRTSCTRKNAQHRLGSSVTQCHTSLPRKHAPCKGRSGGFGPSHLSGLD